MITSCSGGVLLFSEIEQRIDIEFRGLREFAASCAPGGRHCRSDVVPDGIPTQGRTPASLGGTAGATKSHPELQIVVSSRELSPATGS